MDYCAGKCFKPHEVDEAGQLVTFCRRGDQSGSELMTLLINTLVLIQIGHMTWSIQVLLSASSGLSASSDLKCAQVRFLLGIHDFGVLSAIHPQLPPTKFRALVVLVRARL